MQKLQLLIIAAIVFPPAAWGADPPNANARGKHLVYEEAARSYPPAFHPTLPGQMNGPFTVRLVLESVAPNVQNVAVLSPQGKHVAAHSIWFPGSSYVRLRSALVSAEGAICIEGSALSPTGVSPFLAFFATPTSSPKVVRLFPLGAASMAFAPDGTLWAQMTPLGVLEGDELPGDFEVLWQFDRTGTPIKRVAPLSRMALSAGTRRITDAHGYKPQLAVSSRSVVLFVPETKELIEFGFNGAIERRIPVNSVDGADKFALNFLKMSPSGEIVASLNPIGRGTLLRAYRLDRESGVWAPIRPDADTSPKEELVLGFDGEDLVTYSSVDRLIYRLQRKPTEPGQ